MEESGIHEKSNCHLVTRRKKIRHWFLKHLCIKGNKENEYLTIESPDMNGMESEITSKHKPPEDMHVINGTSGREMTVKITDNICKVECTEKCYDISVKFENEKIHVSRAKQEVINTTNADIHSKANVQVFSPSDEYDGYISERNTENQKLNKSCMPKDLNICQESSPHLISENVCTVRPLGKENTQPDSIQFLQDDDLKNEQHSFKKQRNKCSGFDKSMSRIDEGTGGTEWHSSNSVLTSNSYSISPSNLPMQQSLQVHNVHGLKSLRNSSFTDIHMPSECISLSTVKSQERDEHTLCKSVSSSNVHDTELISGSNEFSQNGHIHSRTTMERIRSASITSQDSILDCLLACGTNDKFFKSSSESLFSQISTTIPKSLAELHQSTTSTCVENSEPSTSQNLLQGCSEIHQSTSSTCVENSEPSAGQNLWQNCSVLHQSNTPTQTENPGQFTNQNLLQGCSEIHQSTTPTYVENSEPSAVQNLKNMNKNDTMSKNVDAMHTGNITPQNLLNCERDIHNLQQLSTQSNASMKLIEPEKSLQIEPQHIESNLNKTGIAWQGVVQLHIKNKKDENIKETNTSLQTVDQQSSRNKADANLNETYKASQNNDLLYTENSMHKNILEPDTKCQNVDPKLCTEDSVHRDFAETDTILQNIGQHYKIVTENNLHEETIETVTLQNVDQFSDVHKANVKDIFNQTCPPKTKNDIPLPQCMVPLYVASNRRNFNIQFQFGSDLALCDIYEFPLHNIPNSFLKIEPSQLNRIVSFYKQSHLFLATPEDSSKICHWKFIKRSGQGDVPLHACNEVKSLDSNISVTTEICLQPKTFRCGRKTLKCKGNKKSNCEKDKLEDTDEARFMKTIEKLSVKYHKVLYKYLKLIRSGDQTIKGRNFCINLVFLISLIRSMNVCKLQSCKKFQNRKFGRRMQVNQWCKKKRQKILFREKSRRNHEFGESYEDLHHKTNEHKCVDDFPPCREIFSRQDHEEDHSNTCVELLNCNYMVVPTAEHDFHLSSNQEKNDETKSSCKSVSGKTENGVSKSNNAGWIQSNQRHVTATGSQTEIQYTGQGIVNYSQNNYELPHLNNDNQTCFELCTQASYSANCDRNNDELPLQESPSRNNGEIHFQIPSKQSCFHGHSPQESVYKPPQSNDSKNHHELLSHASNIGNCGQTHHELLSVSSHTRNCGQNHHELSQAMHSSQSCHESRQIRILCKERRGNNIKFFADTGRRTLNNFSNGSHPITNNSVQSSDSDILQIDNEMRCRYPTGSSCLSFTSFSRDKSIKMEKCYLKIKLEKVNGQRHRPIAIKKELNAQQLMKLHHGLVSFFQKRAKSKKDPSFPASIDKYDFQSTSHLIGKIQNVKRLGLLFLQGKLKISRQYRIVSVCPIERQDIPVPQGLDRFFERVLEGDETEIETRMRIEWFRVITFQTYPSITGISTLQLARHGFYYTGHMTETRCYFCRQTYREWDESSDIAAIHRQISPDCPFLNGRETNNVPVHPQALNIFHTAANPGSTSSTSNQEGTGSAPAQSMPLPQVLSISANQSQPASLPLTPLAAAGLPTTTASSASASLPQTQLATASLPTTTVSSSSTSASQSNDSPQSSKSKSKKEKRRKRKEALARAEGNPVSPAASSPVDQLQGTGTEGPPVSSSPSLSQSNTSVSKSSTKSNSSTSSSGSSISEPRNNPPPPGGLVIEEVHHHSSEGAVSSQASAAALPVVTDPNLTSSQGQGASAPSSQSSNSTATNLSSAPPARQSERSGANPPGATSAERLSQLDPLGINFDKPKYPAYAVLQTRINSYQGWPSHMTQTPTEMSRAGFFYAGYGDYARCFFCGGGLRNWDRNDDPWIEHARWFPRCAFLRNNKGDKYVARIQRRHQEQEAGLRPSHQLPPPIERDMDTVQAQTLREMGHKNNDIQQAMNEWRNRLRPGRRMPPPMTAAALMDILFEMEEKAKQEQRPGTDIDIQRPLTIPGLPPPNSEDRDNSGQEDGGNLSTAVSAISENRTDENVTERLPQDYGYDDNERHEMEVLKEEFIGLKETLLCKICCDKDVAAAFLPCGHLVCCLDCAPAMRRCPVCDEIIKGTVKTYFS